MPRREIYQERGCGYRQDLQRGLPLRTPQTQEFGEVVGIPLTKQAAAATPGTSCRWDCVASTLMTMKRSEFGSLGDRRGRATAELDDGRVRHIWLDSTRPALVIDRRKTSGRWEGLVARVEDGELLVGWVNGDRISTLGH